MNLATVLVPRHHRKRLTIWILGSSISAQLRKAMCYQICKTDTFPFLVDDEKIPIKCRLLLGGNARSETSVRRPVNNLAYAHFVGPQGSRYSGLWSIYAPIRQAGKTAFRVSWEREYTLSSLNCMEKVLNHVLMRVPDK